MIHIYIQPLDDYNDQTWLLFEEEAQLGEEAKEEAVIQNQEVPEEPV